MKKAFRLFVAGILFFSISNAQTPITSDNFNSYSPSLTGAGAAGTWGINISGNAPLWSGQTFEGTTTGTINSYMLGLKSSGVWAAYDPYQIRSFLSIPSGGETLQSITDRANTTTNFLTVGSPALGHTTLRPGGSTSAGYIEFYKGDGATRLGYIGYNNSNIEYSAERGDHLFNGGDISLYKASGNPAIRVENSATGSFPVYQLLDNRPGASSWNIEGGRTLGSLGFYHVASGDTKMLIDNSGNVGIGTTSPSSKLAVNGDISLSNRLSFGDGTLYSDINNMASFHNGGFIWSSADNSITKMELASNGDLFVSGNQVIGRNWAQKNLDVNGIVKTRKVKVTQTDWADYVFDSAYQLTPLPLIEKYIQQNKHLPDVPSASEVKKDGVDLGDNQVVLLKKIEELTLYIIEQNKKLEAVCQEVKLLKAEKK